MKRTISLILACVMLAGSFCVTAAAAPGDGTAEAAETETAETDESDEPADNTEAPEETEEISEDEETEYIPVTVDGEDADPDRLAFYLEDELYVPLKAVSEALGSWFYTWNSALQSASLMADDFFLTVSADENIIEANGKTYKIENGLQIADGEAMVPVEALCKAFDVGLEMDEDGAAIDSTVHPRAEAAEKKSGAVSGGGYSGGSYDDDDVYWLSHIIYAEAGGESYEGMVAVGNVVLNRVASGSFPNTIKGVIFQTSQFTPAESGSVYKDPSSAAISAAKDALNGVNVVGGALYFNRAGMSSWASNNRSFVTRIGNHDFFA
ncbi:MAG: cell wall hydrolase [Oscillospiraceae bacterium]|nr:cell wall hydrolase [Oscillospiraceae bacterium]